MRIHFIAIGGSIMHNLAITLHLKGHKVSGSDDEIYDPAHTQLDMHGLLPEKVGWHKNRINNEIDAIILGMHAKKDNPELIKAQSIGIPIYSFPEFIYKESLNKKRVVIAGSHGKTSITSIVMHVLSTCKIDFDYLVGARIKGFDQMTKISDAPIIILEGDEYLSSPLDLKSKFLHYKADLAVISGIAWDHINVFKTFESYCLSFTDFINSMNMGGSLYYYKNDSVLHKLVQDDTNEIKKESYGSFPHRIDGGITYLQHNDQEYPIHLFGEHNMENINAAYKICLNLGITATSFLEAVQSFEGAAKRLELLGKNNSTAIYKDFAHAPSKLKATSNAVKNQFPDRSLVACMELHTFSSLNKKFLGEYRDSMNGIDTAIVYINKKYFDIKSLEEITHSELQEGFNNKKLLSFFDEKELQKYLLSQSWENKNLLMMSSGNFNGLSLEKLADKILN